MTTQAAHALPQDGVVTGGSAVINQTTNTLNVNQSTDRAIIDWQSFDLSTGQSAHFQQPSASSITLNRIRDSKPSQIDGQITANGNIVLVNPKGVVFGENSSVNVNSLVATTSDISDDDAFLNSGTLTFDQAGDADAQILNHGNITAADAGLIGLVAPKVENHGALVARLGKVELHSGDGFTLDFMGNGIAQITISDEVKDQLVANHGLIEAEGGQVILSAAAAREAVNSLIVNTGVIKATSFSQQGGVIRLSAATDHNTTVRNEGVIDVTSTDPEASGSVYLAAKNVENSGTVDASGLTGGTIELTAESIVQSGLIDARGLADMGGVISLLTGDILNTGTITASGVSGGSITMDADTVMQQGTLSADGSIGNGGAIQVLFDTSYSDSATSLVSALSNSASGGLIRIEGGENASLNTSGTFVSTGGEQGGMIDLLAGQDIWLIGALLNANGNQGGGGIRIGGDYLGSGNTRRARNTNIDANTLITADGLIDGDGGRVIVWSDNITDFDGTIYARGGAEGGDGGFVETSGKFYLDFDGLVRASSPHGEAGTWLLDPADIVISSGSTTASGAPNYVPAGTASVVNVTDITNALDAGTNVTITTGGDGFAGDGDITVSSAIYASGTGSLTLSAYRNVNVFAEIAINGGDITIGADNQNNGVGYVMATQTILTAGGDIVIGGGLDPSSDSGVGSSTAAYQYGVRVSRVSAGGGNITINGTGGSYSSGTNHGVAIFSQVDTSGTGTITINGTGGSTSNSNYGIYLGSSATVYSTGSGAISLTGNAGSGTSNYGVYLQASNKIGYNTSNYTGNISIDADGAGLYGTSTTTIRNISGTMDFTGTTNVTGGVNITASGTAITITGTTGDMQVGNIQTSGAAITLSSTGSLTTGTLNTSVGAITLSNGSGDITTGAISASSNNLSITNAYGGINISGAVTIISGTVSLTATDYVYLSSSLYGNAVTVRADSDANSTGYIYIGGSITSLVGDVILGGGADATTGFAVGTNATGTRYGVNVGGISATGGGDIIINGQGGSFSSGNNYGVYLRDTINAYSTGDVIITGTGGSIGDNNYGIYLNNSKHIFHTGSGAITLTGNAGSGNFNYGIRLNLSNTIGYSGTTYTGAISIDADGIGLYTSGGSIRTNNNTLDFTGTTNIIGGVGIYTTNNAISVTGSTGDLNVGTVTTSNAAITLNSAGSLTTGAITTSDGTITLTNGSGDITTGAITTTNNGLSITNSTGLITISGAISVGTSSGQNIALTASDAVYLSSTVSGYSLTVRADSDANSSGYIYIGGAVTTGGGDVILGGGADASTGVAVGTSDAGTRYGVNIRAINANGGDIIINGQGGNYSSGGNYGVYLGGTAQTTGTGVITINGSGGTAGANNYGIYAYNSYHIYHQGSGAISLTGNAGSGSSNYGIYFGLNNVVGYSGATYSGAISIDADGLGLRTSGGYIRTNSNTLDFTGTTNIIGGVGIYTTGNAINFTGSTGDLNVGTVTTSNAAISLNSAGSLTAGDITTSDGAITLTNTSGDITTGAITTTNNGLSITNSTGYIYINGAISVGTSSGQNIVLTASDYIYVSSTISGYSFTARADSDANSSGYVYMGNTITTGGGDVILGGGADATTGFAVGDNASGTRYGVRAGAINANGGSITINGQGGSYSTGGNYGVYLFGTVQTTGTGVITINGTGGAVSNNNYGIYLYNSYHIYHQGSGAISLTGNAGSGTGNFGVRLNLSNIIGYSGATYTGAISIDADGLGLYTSGGYIRTNNNTIDFTGTTSIQGGVGIYTTNNAISFTGSTGNLNVGTVTTSNAAISLNSAGSLTTGDITTSDGVVTLTNTSGDMQFGSITTTNNGLVITNNTGWVSISGNISVGTSAGHDIVLTAADIVYVSGTVSGYSFTAHADSDSNSSGYIYLGNTITTAGGDVILGGGADASTGFAVGGNTSSERYGVNTRAINANGGSITINGLGGTFSSGYNHGVYLSGTVQTTGTGVITINGTGGTVSNNNYGIYLYNNYHIYHQGSGAINLTGNGGSGTGNYGIYLGYNNIIGYSGSTHTGDTTITTDSIYMNISNVRTAGAITVKAYTAGKGISVGADVANTLNLSDTYMGYFHTGSGEFLTIGDTVNTGKVTIDTANSYTGALQFISSDGYDIETAGQLTTSHDDTGTNAAVVIASGQNYINSAGSSVFNLTGGGRWLIYSTEASANTLDGLTLPDEVNGVSYATYLPGAVTETGSVMFYTESGGILRFTASDASMTYGGSVPLFSVTFWCSDGCSAGDAITGSPTVTTTATSSSNAGTYTITVSAGTLAKQAAYSGYTFEFVNGTLTIDPATLTVDADALSKTYGASDPSLTYTYSGLVNGDTSSVFSGALARVAGDNVGTYAINQGTLSAGGNYTIDYTGANFTINQAALTVTADAKSKTYGASDPSLTYTYSGLVNGDTSSVFSGSLTRTAGETVAGGPYAISQGTLTAGGNYSITYTGANLTINPASLTVIADDQSREYGLANPSLTFSCSGLAGGDSCASIFTTAPTLSTSATSASNVGTYAIGISGGAVNSNYSLDTYTPGTLTISQAALTLTADDLSKAYGDAVPTLTYTLSGLRNGDTEGGVLSSVGTSTSATAGSNAGTYAITMAGTLGSGNYSLTLVDGTLTVNAAVLTVTPDDASMTYGGSLPSFSGTITGFVNGDTEGSIVNTTPTYATAATGSSNIGTYNITASGGTLNNSNYTFSYDTGTLTINPATLTVNVNNASMTYGGSLPAFGGSVIGAVGGDSFTASYSSSATGSSNAGTYSILASLSDPGSKLGNYDVTYNYGTLTINKAVLIVSADNVSRTYGTANNFSVSYSGFLNGDTASVISGTAGYSTTATAGSNVGAYSVTPTSGTLSATNYSFAGFNPGTLTVNKANLVVTPTSYSRIYGAANPTFAGTLTNLYSGDNITASYSTAAGQQSNIGNYTISVASLNDPFSKLSNYNVSYNSGTLAITPATLRLVAHNKTRALDAANPTLTYSITGLNPWDNINTVLTSAPTISTTASGSSPMGVYPIVITGGTAANYTVEYTSGSMNVLAQTLISPPIINTKPTGTLTVSNDNSSSDVNEKLLNNIADIGGGNIITLNDCSIQDVRKSNCSGSVSVRVNAGRASN